MVPGGGWLRGPGRAARLAVLLLLASSAVSVHAAIWDNWPGFGGTMPNNQQQQPELGAGAGAGEQPKPKPSVVQSILGSGEGNNNNDNAVDAGTGIPEDLDLKGVDPRSLITPAAAGHAIAPGKCGIYQRGAAEVAVCIESVVEWGGDIKQMNGFLVNRGNAAVCDLIIQPVVPQGATLASFWPDWALENLQEIYLDPGLTTAVGLTMRPNSAPHDALARVDVYAFKDCSRSVDEVAAGDTSFRLVDIERVMPQAVEVLAVGDKAAKAEPPMAAGAFGGHYIQEGECAIYSKPAAGTEAAQATLCVESVIRWGNDVVQVNGFLTNTGKAPLCEVRLGVDPTQQYLSIWPRWAQRGEWLDNFAPGDSVAVGLAAPDTRPDGAIPALVLEDFDICGHPTRGAGGMARDAETGEISFPHPLDATIVSLRDLMGAARQPAPAAQQQRRMQAATVPVADPIPEDKAIPAGKCGVYTKGTAELAVCSESVVQWGKDVQQVNGFMVNMGKGELCDVRLEAVADSGKVYSFWPDWAETGSYEVDFGPKQVTAVGMTVAPSHATPYVEVVSFRDCAAPADKAEGTLEASFELVPIEVVQPPDAQYSLIAEPEVEAPAKDEEDEEDAEYRRRVLAADLIPEGKCAIYTVGTGRLALCIESVLHWGDELTQVNGYLENLGTERLCDLKVSLSGSPKGFEAAWPKWALQGAYAGAFKPGQVSPIGVVAPYQPGAADPTIAVEGFTLCDPDAPVPLNLPPVELVPIAQLKHVDLSQNAPGAAAIPTDKQGPLPPPPPPPPGTPLPSPPPPPGRPGATVTIQPGRCGRATSWGGMFQVQLCVDELQAWGPDMVQLAGQAQNVGEGSICDLRVGHGFAKAAVLTSWPAGVHEGRSALDAPMNPGDRVNLGVTASHSRGLAAAREGVLPFPSLSLVSIKPCNQPANAPPLVLELVDEGPLPPPVTDLLAVRTDDGDEEVDMPRRLAMKGGAEPTTMDTINWDLCGYYTGKDGQSELALCWKDAKTWKDKEAGRVVQTNLVLVNTGKFGVCNVTIEIENIDQELGDHYPQDWIEDGEDIFPSYPGYYAPQQIVNLGAAVPVASGFPEVGISPDFTACSPEPPKPKPARKMNCDIVTNAAGVKLNVCLYADPKTWKEYNGPRVVMVEGVIENVGDLTACNIHVDIEGFANAQAKWGEWMPDFPYKLSPGASLKFGANIPQKKGIPKASVGTFEKCDPVEE